MSTHSRKHPASKIGPKSVRPVKIGESRKAIPSLTAGQPVMVDGESAGFDPYDTASLHIRKATAEL